MKKLLTALAFTCAIGPAQAYTNFKPQQKFEVSSTGYWQAIIYDYKYDDSDVLSMVYRNGGVTMDYIFDDRFYGIWVYDYTAAEFQEAFILMNMNVR